MPTIVYELNEVPKKLFQFFGEAFPYSSFAYLWNRSFLFQTKTADIGTLSPWITWPTMHRGVSNIEHEISELGQDLTSVDKEFPSVHKILAKQGVKVGVFGSLQSYPLPRDLDNYTFYVPDAFAAGEECFPTILSHFQAFNLSMVRANGRNVSKKISINESANFMMRANELGLTLDTFGKMIGQVFLEQLNKDRVVRRRTMQTQIAFDLFFKALKETKPDISFFFTNHVASSMHRYWPTIFPNDYEEGKFDQDWISRWKNEIPYAIKICNMQLKKLITYCIKTETELIVCSSMGQGAVADAIPIKNQVLITNIKKLLGYLGLQEYEWEPRFSMAPRVVIKPLSDEIFSKISKLDKILINNKKIDYIFTNTGDVRFSIDLCDQERLEVYDNSMLISHKDIGIENVNLQDASGSYAYHIPEGILLHYNPQKLQSNNNNSYWTEISVLDFAPTLISKFSKTIPQYMKGENLFHKH